MQQHNFVELSPKAAADRGIRNDEYVWLTTPVGIRMKVKAMITERVGSDTVFVPFHFSGWWEGKDMVDHYPDGSAPIIRGESINTGGTYGYDIVTMMQETKTSLCQVERA